MENIRRMSAWNIWYGCMDTILEIICGFVPIESPRTVAVVDPGGLGATDGELVYWPGIRCWDWRLESRSPSAGGRLAVC